MMTKEEAQTMVDEYHSMNTWRILSWCIQDERDRGGGQQYQVPFREWWDNWSPIVQKTPDNSRIIAAEATAIKKAIVR